MINPDSTNDESNRIGLVNDEPVYDTDYKLLLSYCYRKIKFIKNEKLSKSDSVNAKDSAWEILIKKSILDQQVKQYGIKITDEENRSIDYGDPYNMFVINYFIGVLEPTAENSLSSFAQRRFNYIKLFNEVTKYKSERNDKAMEFDGWYNMLRKKAEIHDLRDRFFRE